MLAHFLLRLVNNLFQLQFIKESPLRCGISENHKWNEKRRNHTKKQELVLERENKFALKVQKNKKNKVMNYRMHSKLLEIIELNCVLKSYVLKQKYVSSFC